MSNKMTVNIGDHQQRLLALDPSLSFIIQAPAGSGKTELLTQRFLVLLANAFQPEEIIAITFTRKAAAEMRERIIGAIQFAESNPVPSESHAAKTWGLAKNVLKRDTKLKWNLLQNPNRLRVCTIDALCARIAKSAPLLSHFGTVPNVIEDATAIYQKAVQSLLDSLEENESWVDALELLLTHLDNNYQTVELLLVGMLHRRDQWLPYVALQKNHEQLRQILEAGLKNIILDKLRQCITCVPSKFKHELLTLVNFAAHNLEFADSSISACKNLINFPEATLDYLPQWIGIAELLLTKQFEWRKSVNKKIGFGPANKEMKNRMITLLQDLEPHEILRHALQEILLLPPPHYSQQQWQIVKALIKVLPILVAHLTVLFRENNVVDFIEIAQAAIHALGDFDTPSDLSLNFDYQIRHLLVDEFQDTSMSQFKLLELMTMGWQPNDGKTLFLVGDPMQSIYRFREAEVGLFLKVKKYGIGEITPLPLTLETNFRSEVKLVEWFNNTFHSIFPSHEDMELGAIPYSPSVGVKASSRLNPINFYPIMQEDETESEIILRIVKDEISKNSTVSIAILVRARSQLMDVISQLKKANINFHAVEIEKLHQCMVVQDLYSLTRALLHPADRIAWLSILRAPWCGLTLHDLAIIAGNHTDSIWGRLLKLDLNCLSEDAKIRLNYCLPIFQKAFENRRRLPLATWIKETWLELGGPACLQHPYELDNAKAFFHLLNQIQHAEEIIDFALLDKKLSQLYATHPPTSNTNVQIMTIHKAKGLEFDVVIIPSLEKKPAFDNHQLLMWQENYRGQHEHNLILAPIKSLDEDYDPIYRYLRFQEKLKSEYEVIRLLYVAMTRAKTAVHLLTNVQVNVSNEIKTGSQGSFLKFLAPLFKDEMECISFPQRNDAFDEAKINNRLFRLTHNWYNNFSSSQNPVLTQNNISEVKLNWKLDFQHHVGTLIHQTLQQISEEGVCNWNKLHLQNQSPLWKNKLLQMGINKNNLEECIKLIARAINNTLNDKRGQWILSEHSQSHSEFELTSIIGDKILHLIIDRTFVDQNGVRWIIDYKSTDFFDNDQLLFKQMVQSKYQDQLNLYAIALQQLDETRPIRIGVYFPLFCGWCDWEFING